jgi:hypothetical protein
MPSRVLGTVVSVFYAPRRGLKCNDAVTKAGRGMVCFRGIGRGDATRVRARRRRVYRPASANLGAR